MAPASLLVTAILLVLTFLGAAFVQQSQFAVALTAQQASIRQNEVQRTAATVTTVSVSGPNLWAYVKNDGQSKVHDRKTIDWIVQYKDSGSVTRWVHPTLTASPQPSTGEWQLEAIQDDNFEPGIWNIGETIRVRIRLPTNHSSGWHTLVMAFPNGVTVVRPYQT